MALMHGSKTRELRAKNLSCCIQHQLLEIKVKMTSDHITLDRNDGHIYKFYFFDNTCRYLLNIWCKVIFSITKQN